MRWVAPVDLSLEAIGLTNPPADPVRGARGQPMATELFAFGRLPLAFSARCFTARHHRLSKDECEFRCLGDADGLLLASSEGQPFLVLNGTQTQSAATQCLLGEGAALRAAGVSRLRLSPVLAADSSKCIAYYDARDQPRRQRGRRRCTRSKTSSLPAASATALPTARPGIEWSNA